MLPWIVGTFLSEVLSNVGLYVLMALGLNIAVGLAGLLDLGYVTNFAVGAYVMGVLTSTGPLGQAELSFWIIVFVSIMSAMFTGFLLALPVLRMRGDYLAIATLGFGEIIRLLGPVRLAGALHRRRAGHSLYSQTANRQLRCRFARKVLLPHSRRLPHHALYLRALEQLAHRPPVDGHA